MMILMTIIIKGNIFIYIFSSSSNNYTTTQVNGNGASNECSGNYNNEAGYYGMFNKYATGN